MRRIFAVFSFVAKPTTMPPHLNRKKREPPLNDPRAVENIQVVASEQVDKRSRSVGPASSNVEKPVALEAEPLDLRVAHEVAPLLTPSATHLGRPCEACALRGQTN